jgi:hypothetical protein
MSDFGSALTDDQRCSTRETVKPRGPALSNRSHLSTDPFEATR